MTEDVMRSQIEIFEDLLDDNLRAAKKALGIEKIVDIHERLEREDKESQKRLKIALNHNEARVSFVDNRTREDRLIENIRYLATKKLEMQAMFAASRAKFIARQQAKQHSLQ